MPRTAVLALLEYNREIRIPQESWFECRGADAARREWTANVQIRSITHSCGNSKDAVCGERDQDRINRVFLEMSSSKKECHKIRSPGPSPSVERQTEKT
nr:hypothetical protein CFP56_28486 [Quercus suber]